MAFLSAMLQDFVLGKGHGTLEAEIVGCQCGYGLSVVGLGRLRHYGRLVKDFSQDDFVVHNRRVGRLLALSKESLDMFCSAV